MTNVSSQLISYPQIVQPIASAVFGLQAGLEKARIHDQLGGFRRPFGEPFDHALVSLRTYLGAGNVTRVDLLKALTETVGNLSGLELIQQGSPDALILAHAGEALRALVGKGGTVCGPEAVFFGSRSVETARNILIKKRQDRGKFVEEEMKVAEGIRQAFMENDDPEAKEVQKNQEERLKELAAYQAAASSSFDLHSLVSLEAVRPIVGEQVAVAVCHDGTPAVVSAPPYLLRKAIEEIVQNAGDAMKGQPKRQLRITTGKFTLDEKALNRLVPERKVLPVKAGNFAVVTINDTGVGINPKYFWKIFDPDFSTKKHPYSLKTKIRSSGLNLVASVIEKAGGFIRVTSEPGKGTTFAICLPLVGGEAIAPPPTPTVLVVEDDQSIRESLVELLEWQGYRVLSAANGAEGLNLVEQCDIVISDITMPVMNGVDAYNASRKQKIKKPFIFVTASDTEAKRLATDLVDKKYKVLKKSYELKDLYSAIEEAVKKSKKRSRHR